MGRKREQNRERERTPAYADPDVWGILAIGLGLAVYLAGVLLVFPRYLLDPAAEWLVWPVEGRRRQ